MSPQRLSHEVPLDFALTDDHDQPQQELESDQSHWSSDDNEDEYMAVDLSDFKELHCPICLGIIRKTAVMMECMHRFCRKCIEKSLRLSNNECPVCRVHCPSRRFLRDDPNYDALISTFVSNIDEYENQIQASRAQTLQPQTQALDRKLKAREIALAFERRRRSIGKNLSSGNENKGTKTRKGRETENQFPHKYVTVNVDGSSTDGYQRNAQISEENARSNRLFRFIDHLHKSDVNNDELEIPLAVVSLNEQRIPSLQEPLLYCRPTMSMKILSKYVALKVELLVDQVQLYLVEESRVNIIRGELTIDPEKDKLRILRDEETLAKLYTRNVRNSGFLLLAYKMK
ncbi:hypothetical protein VNO78_11813 [Psophocarpus tetragonolobus]|uniref:RING-type domain-containing protein n=1 Tax=Psophocarpus tetragonolobus TaxID=3891 RepID=A0AAN9SUX3_PSOTE